MVQETGWDSEKPGYEGLIEVAHRLTVGQDNCKTRDAAVRILRSLFPPLLLELYRMLVAPIDSGKFAALMVARVTALSCQWLMGPCAVNSVDLPNGSSLMSGVFVEKCKYLEESKCVGVCLNTCKLPTQTFFKDHMGVPLLMEPNFTDYSCQHHGNMHNAVQSNGQFKFGILPPQQEVDNALKEPCLEICPNVVRRKEMNHNMDAQKCPKPGQIRMTEDVVVIKDHRNEDQYKKKAKRAGILGFFKAAMFVLRHRTKGKQKAVQVTQQGDWKKLVGSMRPLDLQNNNNNNNTLYCATSPSVASQYASANDLKSLDEPVSLGTMSHYASANNLQDLDQHEEQEDDPDHVFDAIGADDMIDAKAELFILQFYQQMRCQNIDSISGQFN